MPKLQQARLFTSHGIQFPAADLAAEHHSVRQAGEPLFVSPVEDIICLSVLIIPPEAFCAITRRGEFAYFSDVIAGMPHILRNFTVIFRSPPAACPYLMLLMIIHLPR